MTDIELNDETGDENTSKRNEAKLREVHEEALADFTRVQTIMKDERDQCLEDRRFYSIAGAQWEGPLGEQFGNKPRFEVNKIHLSVIRIFNEYRNNRITVNFVPKDGSKGGKLTDTCNGLYRADEQNSGAEEAYDNAFEEGVGGGFGAWRLRNDYVDDEDEDDDEQCIYIEPIFDADSSVYFDPDAKRQDKSDANYCYVLSSMTHQRFKAEYPDAVWPTSFPKTTKSTQFDWYTPSVVYIAEYYKVEKVAITQITYTGLSGEVQKYDKAAFDDKEVGPELKKQLAATGFTKTKTKTITRRKVHKYIMSGTGIVDDLGYIAGKHIPIVPFYGKRWFIDNVERCMGQVRLAKDTQRLKNMQISKMGEIAAFSTVEKPIVTPQQINGHQVSWSRDNIDNNPYLLLNPILDAQGQLLPTGPIAYTKVPNIPPAMAALLQMTDADMSDLLGNQEAGEVVTPGTSGVAIDLVQAKLDMQTFIYISNMCKAIKRSGEIWLEMAKEIYVEKDRKRKTVNEAGEASSVILNQPGKNDETGVVETQNNLTEADFDVNATPGPTSASKKAATVRALVNLLGVTQDPETVQVLTAMIMMNMEGEGIGEIRDYFRKKLLTMGVAQPTPEEAAELEKKQAEAANQPPDANTQFLQASAEEAAANALKAKASVVATTATAEKTKAETMQILQDLEGGKIETVMGAIERLQAMALKSGSLVPPGAAPAPTAPAPASGATIEQIPS
jgi:hypothetical protein